MPEDDTPEDTQGVDLKRGTTDGEERPYPVCRVPTGRGLVGKDVSVGDLRDFLDTVEGEKRGSRGR